jgi:hypothetical protein
MLRNEGAQAREREAVRVLRALGGAAMGLHVVRITEGAGKTRSAAEFLERGFHQGLRVRSRDQDGRRYVEVEGPELPSPDDVAKGLTRRAAANEFLELPGPLASRKSRRASRRASSIPAAERRAAAARRISGEDQGSMECC